MRYGSVCSGIEAATVAWQPLGWHAAWFADIDKFPSAVLAHRFPEVPNLGDFTKIGKEHGTIDLLVGGTPCQDFSVAGLRAGLDGERGQLTIEFVRLAARLCPRWLVWENVPGVLSADGGRACGIFLDEMNKAGFSVECDILDACHFGVPQRRRRVFVIGFNVRHGQNRKMPFFAATAAQCLTELSLCVLAAHCDLSSIGGSPSGWPSKFYAAGARKRIELFGLSLNGVEALKNLLSDMEDASVSGRIARDNSASPLGMEGGRQGNWRLATADMSLPTIGTGEGCSSTPLSWKEWLDAVCDVANVSTISTTTEATTERKIYTCAVACLSIAVSMLPLIESCPSLFNAESSGLTALKAFTNYARWTSSTLFGRLGWVHDWNSFEESAAGTQLLIERYLGDWRPPAAVLFEPESLRGDHPPRQGSREDTAPTLSGRTRGGGGLGSDAEIDGALVAPTLDGRSGRSGENSFATSGGLIARCDTAGEGQRNDWETCTFAIQERAVSENVNNGPQGKGWQKGTVYTLEARNKVQAVAFDLRGRDGGAMPEGEHNTASLRAASGGSSRSYLAIPQVRRITPREAERLQGFPDDWTLVPWRGKLAADGPRYRAIGNSMAVPVMRWIGERIQMCEEVMTS